ncbi:hypothetical protein LTR36_009967 [Oleoguttula mirabilis]|uniref:Uncharacterized protein n=1 Tax=Oleoguttula mirabilis TaxID=1507867 RepID=A0AAV9J4M2_9PEZI|nr:hypothetical protein LTR36_009967 [Oleoguttula mirabilis]
MSCTGGFGNKRKHESSVESPAKRLRFDTRSAKTSSRNHDAFPPSPAIYAEQEARKQSPGSGTHVEANENRGSISASQTLSRDEDQVTSLRRIFSLLVPRCRIVDRSEEQHAEIEKEIHRLQEGDDGIVSTIRSLTSLTDGDDEYDQYVRRDTESELAGLFQTKRLAQERGATLRKRIDADLSAVSQLEDELHIVLIDAETQELDVVLTHKLLPDVGDAFFEQLSKDYATRQADQGNQSIRQSFEEGIETVREGLEVAQGVPADCNANPDNPWTDTIYVEHRIDEYMKSIARTTEQCRQLDVVLGLMP